MTDIIETKVPEIAANVVDRIKEKNKKNKWKLAQMYYCIAHDTSASLDKLRILLNDGTWEKSISPPRAPVFMLLNFRESLKTIQGQVWYGFKLTVYPDGRHEIEYNHNPECIDDPNFIDW